MYLSTVPEIAFHNCAGNALHIIWIVSARINEENIYYKIYIIARRKSETVRVGNSFTSSFSLFGPQAQGNVQA